MSTELSNGVIIPEEYSDDWYDEMSINLRKLNDVIGSDSEKLNADGVDFLRMSSAALTDGGTGNFSDLNSSYKIKTGDLVLDSGRKLYQIVSVDSTNETFTVGNYLFKVTAESDLALVAESGDYDDLDNKPDLNPYDQHIANTDIHVTTADKNKWNNQTYVFRYSSTALTPSSTNSNTLLDNTDNLKVGDKVIDSSGVLFSITAIDTANSTFTVGSALVDLALDGNVVHTSGNETKSGELTLSDTLNSSDIVPIANNSYSSGSSNNQWNNIYSMNYYYNGVAWGLDKSNTWTSSQTYSTGYYGQMIWLKNTDLDLSVNGNTGLSSIYQHMIHWVDKNNAVYSSIQAWTASSETTLVLRSKYRTDANTIRELSVRFTSTATNKVIYPETNADTELGTSTNKWKSFNGLTPSSLSLPDLSNGIDISSYITDLTGASNINKYTPVVNGWISVGLSNAEFIELYIPSALMGGTFTKTSTNNYAQAFMPVIANKEVRISLKGASIGWAKFYPCQGNV